MAKIILNNKEYNIDDAILASINNELKNHFTNVMSGSGVTIAFGGTTYGIDSTKFSAATADIVAHLGTISGSGKKVVVNGVEYGVDSNKVSGAVSELEAVLGGLNNPDAPTPTEERLEGDGAEFYTLAPTALSFRSTAPLNELQEIQINGVTVDPSNYTLEEGSTIVTFPIDYLKTLNVGSYEVAVASDSKTVKGGFTVAAPELNEYGFYYNQPYTAYVAMFGENESFFIREGGTMDIVGTPSGSVNQATYSVSGNIITVVSPLVGTLTGTISADGVEIYCNELAIAFKLGDESIVADNDYIYTYVNELGGYQVLVIDITKTSYDVIKTGINGVDTIKLADGMFSVGAIPNTNMIIAPKMPDTILYIGASAFEGCSALTSINIPNSVTTIGDNAFHCTALESVTFKGTVEQWNAVVKGDKAFWIANGHATHVQCSDGQVAL